MFIQTYTESRDEYRQVHREWFDTAPFWGLLEVAYKGQEMMGGQRDSQVPQQISLSQLWIFLRYRTDITISTTHRVRFGERYFDINAVYDDHSRQETLKLLCTEVQR